jgi:carboxymethylenebutenolidase
MESSTMSNISGMEHSYRSGGERIRVQTFPAEDGAGPSVLILHGASGVRMANAVVSGIMQFLAGHGFLMHLIHYFDRSGTSYADDATIHRNFHAWRETLHDGIAYLSGRYPDRKLGLVGHSLGGFLAAAEMVENPTVAATVVISGGLDLESSRNVRRTAPTLILHGSSDTRVPITEAQRLESALIAKGAPPVVHVYRGEGHTLGMSSFADGLQRSVNFLRAHLS